MRTGVGRPTRDQRLEVELYAVQNGCTCTPIETVWIQVPGGHVVRIVHQSWDCPMMLLLGD